jgi:ribosomal protein S18 acetylase RimI-like enzyme
MIRPTTPADTPELLTLTAATGFFKPHDVEILQEVLDDYHASNREEGHRAVTSERGGQVVGFAYYAPTPMTAGTWTLWWIAVSKTSQSRGLGGELLHYVEEDVRGQGGRLLLIETSSVAMYEPTRKFYGKHGYEQEAVVRDYYADGDGLVIYRKRLSGPPDSPGATPPESETRRADPEPGKEAL